MKHGEQFYKLYKISRSSPTGIIKKSTGKPAGYKSKAGYWCLSGRVNGIVYNWKIPRVLFEHHSKLTLPANVKVAFIDGNSNNLKINNLMLKTYKQK
ncbi:hypothetical protein QUR06_000254 [Escherichia coli]|nr:hypothetical protein [Escherichia coli]